MGLVEPQLVGFSTVLLDVEKKLWLFVFKLQQTFLHGLVSAHAVGGYADTKFHASASQTTGKIVRNTTASRWAIPYCSQCVRHKEAFKSAENWFSVSFVLGVFVWYFVAQSNDAIVGFIAGLVVAILGGIPYKKAVNQAKEIMSESCCSLTNPVQYVEWHGTSHRFVFTSKAYLDLFLSANSSEKCSDITEV
jgi:hypothetical protein